MAMKETWFQHTDYITWTVSARLPESNHPPRADRRWQNRMWG